MQAHQEATIDLMNENARLKAALVARAGEALKGSVKLSNEVIGVMSLMETGIKPTPGIIAAMRRYLRDVEAFVDAIEGASAKVS